MWKEKYLKTCRTGMPRLVNLAGKRFCIMLDKVGLIRHKGTCVKSLKKRKRDNFQSQVRSATLEALSGTPCDDFMVGIRS
jgi:hypothetical protein